jgi:hypothetical protein
LCSRWQQLSNCASSEENSKERARNPTSRRACLWVVRTREALALFSLLILLLPMRPAYTPNPDIVLDAVLGFGGFAAFHAHAGEVLAAEPLLSDSAAKLADPAKIFEAVLLADCLSTLLRGLAAGSRSTFAPWLLFWLLFRVLFWLVWRTHVPALFTQASTATGAADVTSQLFLPIILSGMGSHGK